MDAVENGYTLARSPIQAELTKTNLPVGVMSSGSPET
jgi:hypothetical protein